MGWTASCVKAEHKDCSDTRKDKCICDCPCHLTRHPKVRNAFALHATSRKAGPMKHRNTPRGGAKNKQREYKEEA